MIELSKLEEWEEWIPKGERELYERDPENATVMELKFLTKEKRDHYQRLARKYQGQGLVSSADAKATRTLFSDHVRNIRNMKIGGVEIIDGGQLYDVDGFDLIQVEILDALMQRSSLEVGLAKKLRSASDSMSSHQTANADGGAAVATLQSPPTIQVAPEKSESSDFPMRRSGGSEVVMETPRRSSTSGRQI